MDTTQLLKGVLDVAVLAVVEDEDGYGYDVLRRLRTGGLSEVGDASVYGTLRRLYAAGALTSYVVPSDEGPHRKYYGITSAGRDQLATQTKDWERFAQTVTALLSDTAAATTAAATAATTAAAAAATTAATTAADRRQPEGARS
jgi:PadR family transcriptional regulator PadR